MAKTAPWHTWHIVKFSQLDVNKQLMQVRWGLCCFNYNTNSSPIKLVMPRKKGTTGKFLFNEEEFLLTHMTTQLTIHTIWSINCGWNVGWPKKQKILSIALGCLVEEVTLSWFTALVKKIRTEREKLKGAEIKCLKRQKLNKTIFLNKKSCMYPCFQF